MKRILGLLILLLFMAVSAGAQVAPTVTPSPTSFRIPKSTASTITIGYSLADAACASAVSSQGQFLAGSTVIGTVASSVSATLSGPVGAPSKTGSASETVSVPRSVLIRAERMKTNTFTFKRTFNFSGPLPCSPGSATATVSVRIISKAAAGLKITRLQLYFDNKRPETTVVKNQPSPMVYARLGFAGSGILEGRWEVDGRILSYVRRHLHYGRDLIIRTPRIPGLPTFEEGTHRVRLVITRPSAEIDEPVAIYEVVPGEYEGASGITVLRPLKDGRVGPDGAEFAWNDRPGMETYLVQFYEEGGITPVFSAYTRDSSYIIPSLVMKKMFIPGQYYIWKVMGFDKDSNVAGESVTRRFVVVRGK